MKNIAAENTNTSLLTLNELLEAVCGSVVGNFDSSLFSFNRTFFFQLFHPSVAVLHQNFRNPDLYDICL